MSMLPVCLIVGLGVAAFAEGSFGQEAIAPVEGNRSDHRDWQPTEGEVQAREDAAGIEVPVQQQQATDKTLDQLNEELMQTNQQLQGEVSRLDGHTGGQ
jgi:hypothetical protein